MKLLRFFKRRFLTSQKLDKSIIDYLYADLAIKKMINYLMFDGNRLGATNLFLKTLTYLKYLTGLSPVYVFKRAINNCFLLFDITPMNQKRSVKRKFVKRKTKFFFTLTSPNLKIVRSSRFIYNLALVLRSSSKNKKLNFIEILAYAILFTFLRKGKIFKKIKYMYKYLFRKRAKLKELSILKKTSRKFFIKVGRYRKEKGLLNFNPYAIAPWLKLTK